MSGAQAGKQNAAKQRKGRQGNKATTRKPRRNSVSAMVATPPSAMPGDGISARHRALLERLHLAARLLADRVGQLLDDANGGNGPACLGERESPADALEKLSRVLSRLIPLEREAFGAGDRVERTRLSASDAEILANWLKHNAREAGDAKG